MCSKLQIQQIVLQACSNSTKNTEIQFGTWEHMLLPSENNISKCQKVLNKNFALTSQHSMCVHAREKPFFFVACVKMTKKN
jgi:hypothetical protein